MRFADPLELDDATNALSVTADGADVPEQLDTYLSEAMAARSAVVLAKSQATAARAEAQELAGRVRRLTSELEEETAERERLAAALSASQRAQAILERDKAVAEARADEVRRQVEQDRMERGLLSARIGLLEADREEAIAAMGWWSRRRYNRRRSANRPLPPN